MKLAPCPFCGSNNLDDSCRLNDGDGTRDYYFMFCNECEAEGPTSNDQAEAQRLWNKRSEENHD